MRQKQVRNQKLSSFKCDLRPSTKCKRNVTQTTKMEILIATENESKNTKNIFICCASLGRCKETERSFISPSAENRNRKRKKKCGTNDWARKKSTANDKYVFVSSVVVVFVLFVLCAYYVLYVLTIDNGRIQMVRNW